MIRHALAVALTAFAAACAPESPETPVRLAADTLLDVGDTRLFVHREGPFESSAPPLVVIHGGPLLDQGYLRSPLAPLASDRELVFYDQRLNGRSDATADSTSIRIATFVEDLERIRTSLDLGRIDLLAHSWGGLIALAGIPDATLVVFDDTRHFAFLESPERFLAELRAFLAR